MSILEKVPLLRPSNSEETNLFQDQNRAAREHRQKLTNWALNGHHTARVDRAKQERQWYLNLAFYFGEHYVRFRGARRGNFDMYTPNAPYYRVRPVINYVRKMARKDIARLTSQKPNAYVVPASSEDQDLFAAQAAEQVWDSVHHREKLHKKLIKAVFWAETCGNGFIKQYWDDDKKDPDNPEAVGDLAFSTESPFHIYVPDLLADDIEDQPWVIHTKAVTPEFAKRFYGRDLSADSTMTDGVNASFMSVMDVNPTNRNKVTLYEVCVKPGATDLLPEGGYFTIAGNQIVDGGEGLPYSHGEFPYSKIDMTPSGKFYSDSVIVDLIPMQRELNRTVGQVIEAKNRMAKPQLAAEEGSLDATKITTEPGLVIFFRSGFGPPTPIPMQSLPAYVLEQIDRDLAFMSDLAGQHEVSKGQVPPGVTAATAISYLQEADDSILSTAYTSVEEAMEKTAKQSLQIAKEFWTTERLVKITGSDGTFDSLMLKGSALAYDIRVEGGSALPTSKAAKQAFIMDMMTRGFIDPEEGLSVMEMGGLNKIYDRIQVDVKQVQRENIKLKSLTPDMIQQHIENWQIGVEKGPEKFPEGFDLETIDPVSGEPVALEAPTIIPVNSWDNHEMHIEYHNRYRKSQAFEMAPEHVKAAFEEHVKEHEEILMMLNAPGELQGANPLTPGEDGGTMESAELQQPSEGEPGAESEELQPGPEPIPENSEVMQ